MTRASFPDKLDRFQLAARLAAVLYVAWGLFHVRVAWDIYGLGEPESGLVQGRLFQLAAYMLTIALFVVSVALLLNWKNNRVGYWLNLCVAGWADLIWSQSSWRQVMSDWCVAWHRLSSSSLHPFSRRSAEGHRTSGRHSPEAPVCRPRGPVSEHETFSADNANIERQRFRAA